MRSFMSHLKTSRVALTALGVLTAVATATVAAPADAASDNHGGHGRVVDRGDHGRVDHWRGGGPGYRWGGPRGVYYPGYAYYPGYYDYYAPPYYAPPYPVYPAPGLSFGFRVR